MSLVLHDTRCAEGHVETNVACVKGEDGFPVYPPCSVCEAPTRPFFGGASARAHLWKPRTLDGVVYETEADWKRYLAATAENLMVPVDRLAEVSNSDHKVRADEAMHRSYLTHKREGVDEARLAEYRRDIARQKGRVEAPIRSGPWTR
jgi:hypothetical protein